MCFVCWVNSVGWLLSELGGSTGGMVKGDVGMGNGGAAPANDEDCCDRR
jgi:hypothetical protein